MKKFKNFVVLILFLTTILAYGYGEYKEDRYEQRIAELQSAAPDTFFAVDSTSVISLTREVEEVRIERDDLKKVIDDLKGDVRHYTNLIGEYKIRVEELETQPVIIEEKEARRFAYEDSSFSIRGHFFLTDPYTLSIDYIRAILELEVVAVEVEKGVWKTIVHHPTKNFKIKTLTTRAVPYKPTFWEKLSLIAGPYASVNRIGLFSSFGYNKYSVNFLADTHGTAVGFSYKVF